MTQLTPVYEELRRTTGASVPFLEMMQQRDRIQAEKDALRDVRRLHATERVGDRHSVPLEKLRALLNPGD